MGMDRGWPGALVQWMRDGGITQEWVAERCGVTQSCVSGWVRGKLPNARNAAQLVMLGIPLSTWLPRD